MNGHTTNASWIESLLPRRRAAGINWLADYRALVLGAPIYMWWQFYFLVVISFSSRFCFGYCSDTFHNLTSFLIIRLLLTFSSSRLLRKTFSPHCFAHWSPVSCLQFRTMQSDLAPMCIFGKWEIAHKWEKFVVKKVSKKYAENCHFTFDCFDL